MTAAADYPMLEHWALNTRLESEARRALDEIDRLRVDVAFTLGIVWALTRYWRWA